MALEDLVYKGHEVIFASARPIRNLLPVLHERFHQYPMIGGNGSIIASKGEIVSTVIFEEKTLIDYLQNIKKSSCYLFERLCKCKWCKELKLPLGHPLKEEDYIFISRTNEKLDHLTHIIML
ncbi:hypothetical protein BK049_01575 [Bacillus xiamenensis]|uniref:Uncharacterized protein n=1 Tax=Bacillus xiamenensis TaxID=1178537 RepID=A0AAC9NB66_9BACI|nr:hypothetical protein BK049_01575 [Bacillus xiamenensis]